MTRDRAGTGVTASPFNPVKLELAVIVVAGVVMWLVQGRVSADAFTQFLLMTVYGGAAMAWLVLRVRAVQARGGAAPPAAHDPRHDAE